MSNPWFRLYAEFAGDPVVQSLAFEDQRHYVVLLCAKCDGTLDRDIAPNVRERIICRSLGLDPVTAAEVKRRLLEVGLIDKTWQPTAWDKRQYISDNSTDRVRKYRKNKQIGNVSGTLQNRFGNGPDTETDTEQKTPPLIIPPPAENPTKKPRASTAHGTRLDIDKMPDEWRREAQRIAPCANHEALFAEFCDYWRGVPGQRGRKADWLATWRNRLRQSAERMTTTRGRPTVDQLREGLKHE